MNARSILSLFKCPNQLKTGQVKTPLGRWNAHNHKETSLKIKYANEDNCGLSCLPTEPLDQNYMYMMGYESAHK